MIQDNKELIANLPRYLNNVNLKAADAELPLSIDQLAEMEKIMRDPIYFIENYVRIISIDDGWIPFKLYPYQKRLISLVHNERKVIAKFPRQSGKCIHFDTLITIRNRSDGEIYSVKVGEFYEWQTARKYIKENIIF